MRLIKKGGQALFFFVLDLRHSSMDSFGVRSLGSAAAQGGQDTSTEHTNGSLFTGWDASVQASRDASCQNTIIFHQCPSVMRVHRI